MIENATDLRPASILSPSYTSKSLMSSRRAPPASMIIDSIPPTGTVLSTVKLKSLLTAGKLAIPAYFTSNVA